jgi:hypothetical protein
MPPGGVAESNPESPAQLSSLTAKTLNHLKARAYKAQSLYITTTRSVSSTKYHTAEIDIR